MGFFDTLGRVKTRIVFWFFLIVLLMVMIGGVVAFFQNHHTEIATSTLHQVICVPSIQTAQNGARSGLLDCSGQQTYEVDGHPYNLTYSEMNLSVPRHDGETSTLYYNPKDPADASTTSRATVTTLTLIASAILFLIVVLSYFRYEMSQNNKYWATGEGVLTGVNVFANLVNS